MDTSKIVETLNAFVVGNNKSIVLDGKWGIGKTYKINEFLKGFYSKFNKKKYRVHYVSLFGKKGIDTVEPTMDEVKTDANINNLIVGNGCLVLQCTLS